jgi:hypothetical protein
MVEQDTMRAKKEAERSISVVTNTLGYLNFKLEMGLPALERQKFIAEKARAEGELIHLSLLNANLHAGIVIVEPIQSGEAARLDELAVILDQAIEDDFIFNATLALAMKIVDAAKEVHDIFNA